jgi:hypothetical protein
MTSGSVRRTKATRLKPAAVAWSTPKSVSAKTQKNCQGPTFPGALGIRIPMLIMARTAAAWRGERSMW